MKILSILYKSLVGANLLLIAVAASGNNAYSQGRASVNNYSSSCSFYGQNQPQAQAIGCSISQNSNQIVIRWNDGVTTTLNNAGNGSWRSMPSGARAEARFYYGSGDVAHVEIFEGPGKGIILVNDRNTSGNSPVQTNYPTQCSFYGQNQAQATSIGCSISQQSNRILITWSDGITTTLNYGGGSGWRSMPSGARAEARFYEGTGGLAHVEIFEGPGKGLIIVRPR
jgi:hypothetical protein